LGFLGQNGLLFAGQNGTTAEDQDRDDDPNHDFSLADLAIWKSNAG
jgi:hypothetical protein